LPLARATKPKNIKQITKRSFLMRFLNEMVVRMRSEDGQGLAEYGLILALIAVICIAALTTLQGGITGSLEGVAAAM
jgi:pilus assembly protein Flp/PilA